MIETFVYLCLSILLICSTHLWSAVKSGCFYGKGTADYKNPLKPYMENLHRVQTPFWYSLFGAMFFYTITILRLYDGDSFGYAILSGEYFIRLLQAVIITMGASSACGVFYQGFINVGAGKPFVDPDEKGKFELANPFGYETIWINKFWHGRNRIWVSALGFSVLVTTLLWAFK